MDQERKGGLCGSSQGSGQGTTSKGVVPYVAPCFSLDWAPTESGQTQGWESNVYKVYQNRWGTPVLFQKKLEGF
jgi:hypothetical protein